MNPTICSPRRLWPCSNPRPPSTSIPPATHLCLTRAASASSQPPRSWSEASGLTPTSASAVHSSPALIFPPARWIRAITTRAKPVAAGWAGDAATSEGSSVRSTYWRLEEDGGATGAGARLRGRCEPGVEPPGAAPSEGCAREGREGIPPGSRATGASSFNSRPKEVARRCWAAMMTWLRNQSTCTVGARAWHGHEMHSHAPLVRPFIVRLAKPSHLASCPTRPPAFGTKATSSCRGMGMFGRAAARLRTCRITCRTRSFDSCRVRGPGGVKGNVSKDKRRSRTVVSAAHDRRRGRGIEQSICRRSAREQCTALIHLLQAT